jgi:hypothetical protein
MAQAAGALDRPGPPRPGRRPGQQALRLDSAGADPQLTQRLLRRADRHCRVRGLVRIDPDHDYRHGNTPSLPVGKDRGGHAQFRDHCGVHASFEPHHGEAPASWHVVRKPTPAGRQAEEEPRPTGTSQRYDLTHFHPGQARTVYPKSQLSGSVRVLRGSRGHSACSRPATPMLADPALTAPWPQDRSSGLHGPALPDMDFRNRASSNVLSNFVSECGSTGFVEDLVRLTGRGRGR